MCGRCGCGLLAARNYSRHKMNNMCVRHIDFRLWKQRIACARSPRRTGILFKPSENLKAPKQTINPFERIPLMSRAVGCFVSSINIYSVSRLAAATTACTRIDWSCFGANFLYENINSIFALSCHKGDDDFQSKSCNDSVPCMLPQYGQLNVKRISCIRRNSSTWTLCAIRCNKCQAIRWAVSTMQIIRLARVWAMMDRVFVRWIPNFVHTALTQSAWHKYVSVLIFYLPNTIFFVST